MFFKRPYRGIIEEEELVLRAILQRTDARSQCREEDDGWVIAGRGRAGGFKCLSVTTEGGHWVPIGCGHAYGYLRGRYELCHSCLKMIPELQESVLCAIFQLEENQHTIFSEAVSYTHLRAHETDSYLVCRLLLEKKNK